MAPDVKTATRYSEIMDAIMPSVRHIIINNANPPMNPHIRKLFYMFVHESPTPKIARTSCCYFVVRLRKLSEELEFRKAKSVLVAFLAYIGEAEEQKLGTFASTVEEDLVEVIVPRAMKEVFHLRPRHIAKGVNVLFRLCDRQNKLRKKAADLLYATLYADTQRTLQWVNELQLDDFRDRKLNEIVLLVLTTPGIDITKVLFVDNVVTRQVVIFLDSLVAVHFHGSTSGDPLYKKFWLQFNNARLTQRIRSYADGVIDPQDLPELIPNTIKFRRSADFLQKFIVANSDEDRFNMFREQWRSLQAVYIFRAVSNRDAAFTVAALTALGVPEFDLVKVVPRSIYRTVIKSVAVESLILTFKKILEATPSEKVSFLPDNGCGYTTRLIDTKKTFDEFLIALKGAKDIAFDVEGSFVFQNMRSDVAAALLQILIGDVVYVVDLYTLEEILKKERFDELWEAFCESKLLRIGFDIDMDLRMLERAFPSFKDVLEKHEPWFCCVKSIANIIIGDPILSKEVFDDQLSKVSLQDLVKFFLNEDLEKQEQHSNWYNRPITVEQLTYAAKDAMYTGMVFDKLSDRIGQSSASKEDSRLQLFCTRRRNKTADENLKVRPAPTKSKYAAERHLTDILKYQHERFGDVQTVGEARQEHGSRQAKDCVVFVDPPHLGTVNLFRRCGFTVIDHRHMSTDAAKPRPIQIEELSRAIDNSPVSKANSFLVVNPSVTSYNSRMHSGNIIRVQPTLALCDIVKKLLVAAEILVGPEIFDNCPRCSSASSVLKAPFKVYVLVMLLEIIKSNRQWPHDPTPEEMDAARDAVTQLPDWRLKDDDIICDKLSISFDALPEGMFFHDRKTDTKSLTRVICEANIKNPRNVEKISFCSKCCVFY